MSAYTADRGGGKMTNGEKHIEKLLSWYKEAVTEDGICYLNSDDKNTLAYAIKCCKHFEDIKKDVDSWGLRKEPSSSEKTNLSENPISSTTKTCETCRYGGSYHKLCHYCYKCSLWIEKITKKCITCAYREIDGKPHEMCKSCVCGDRYREDSTTKNDLGADCVSRQAVIDMTGLSEWFDSSDSYNEFVIALSNLPPVTPIRPKGHWVDKFGGVYRCSCCREIISIDTIEFPYGITYKYCPYCGSHNLVKIEKEGDKE